MNDDRSPSSKAAFNQKSRITDVLATLRENQAAAKSPEEKQRADLALQEWREKRKAGLSKSQAASYERVVKKNRDEVRAIVQTFRKNKEQIMQQAKNKALVKPNTLDFRAPFRRLWQKKISLDEYARTAYRTQRNKAINLQGREAEQDNFLSSLSKQREVTPQQRRAIFERAQKQGTLQHQFSRER